jgi:hypothetical protein
MRPTDLRFRSPKEGTGEYVIPMAVNTGDTMSYIRKNATYTWRSSEENKKYTTFSASDRFSYQKVSYLCFYLFRKMSKENLWGPGPTNLKIASISYKKSMQKEEM